MNPEKLWRLLWMRAIAASLPGPRTATLPINRPLRTLFLRYERIGDLIMATGLIRALATSGHVEWLDVVVNPTTKPVLEHNPHVRKVFTLDRKAWSSYRDVGRQLRREDYEVIVDGRLNNPPIFTSTPLLMRYADAPFRVGTGGGNNDLVYNVRVPSYAHETHYVEASRSLAVPFGVDPDTTDWQPEIFLTADEKRRSNEVWKRAAARLASPGNLALDTMGIEPRLLVNLSASEPKRRWSDDKFAAVLARVRADHPRMPIAVMALPSEWESVQKVAKAINAEAAATPKLREALSLVGTSDRVFTPDTSISHAASAFRKPAVVLLKRQHAPYAPWGIPAEIVFWDGDTIASLETGVVQSALDRMLRAELAPASRAGTAVAG